MRLMIGVLAAVGSLLAQSMVAGAQTTDNPAYFIPPPAPPATTVAPGQPAKQGGAVVSAHPVGLASPVIDNTLVDTLPPPNILAYQTAQPWYETDWGVFAIGAAATGTAMFFDHGVNVYTTTKINPEIQNKVLKADNVLETLTAIFPFITMVQSPISDPELAHASSIAATSVVEVTLVTMGLKYAIGRDRPAGPDSSPFVAQPFDAANSTFSLAAVLPFGGAQTSSWPSGHTALAFAVVTPYAELYHQPLLYAIPVAVGLGRVVSPDGHWLSDVVGGGFIGWLTADITRRYFPNSDYGLMIFGDGREMTVGFHGPF